MYAAMPTGLQQNTTNNVQSRRFIKNKTCRADMNLGSGLATIAVKLYPLLEHQSFQNTSLISYPSFWIGAIKLRKMDLRTSSYHFLLI
jgi:hypothetical protein